MSKRRLAEEQAKKSQFLKEIWLLVENVIGGDGNGPRFEVVCVDPRVAADEDQNIERNRWLYIQPDGQGPPRLVLIRYISRSRERTERLRRRQERDRTKWTSRRDEPPKKNINRSICPSSMHSIRDAKRELRKKASKQRLKYAREAENEFILAKRRRSDRTRQFDGAIPSCSGVSRTRRLQTPTPPPPPRTSSENSIAEEESYSSDNERRSSSSTDEKRKINRPVKSNAKHSKHKSRRSEKSLKSSHRSSLRGYEYHRRRLMMITPSPECNHNDKIPKCHHDDKSPKCHHDDKSPKCNHDVKKLTTDQSTQTDPMEEDPAILAGQEALIHLGGLIESITEQFNSLTESIRFEGIEFPQIDTDASESEIQRISERYENQLREKGFLVSETEEEDEDSSAPEPESENEDSEAEDEDLEAEDEDIKAEDEDSKAEDEELAAEDEDLEAEGEDLEAEGEDLEAEDEDLGEEEEDMEAEDDELEAEDEDLEAEDEESSPPDPEAEDEDSSPPDPEAEDEDSPPPEHQAENGDSSPQPMRRVSPPVQAIAAPSVPRVPTPQQPVVGSVEQADGGQSSNESGEHFMAPSNIMGAGPSGQRMVKVRRVSAHTTNRIERAPGEELVPIGNGRAMVPARLLEEINWNSYTQATRQLLQAVFPRRVLATHSLTGKRSPAFMDKPPKKRLNPQLVEDVVIVVTLRCGVTERLVRNCITIKCTDEAKLYRNRQQCRQGRLQGSDQENVPPNHTTDDTTETSSGDS